MIMFRNTRTKTWQTEGILTSFQKGFPQFQKRRLTVRYTSDKAGKSLSISDDNNGVMFQIPFDGILQEIMKEGENK